MEYKRIVALGIWYVLAILVAYAVGPMARILRRYRNCYGTPDKKWFWVAAAFEAANSVFILVYLLLFVDSEKSLMTMLVQSVPAMIVLALVYGGVTYWLGKRFRIGQDE